MQRARARIRALTSRSRAGARMPETIASLNLFLRGLAATSAPGTRQTSSPDGPLRGIAAEALADQEARPQPASPSGGPLDPRLCPDRRRWVLAADSSRR